MEEVDVPGVNIASFGILMTAIRRLSEQTEVPSTISNAILKRLIGQSGTVRKGLLDTLFALSLIDSDGVPTPQLRQLLVTYGKGDWPNAIREVLEIALPGIFSKQDDTIDLAYVRAHFVTINDEDAERTMRAAVRLFKALAAEAEVDLRAHTRSSNEQFQASDQSLAEGSPRKRNVHESAVGKTGRSQRQTICNIRVPVDSLANMSSERFGLFFSFIAKLPNCHVSFLVEESG
jgi:hypothetical protein